MTYLVSVHCPQHSILFPVNTIYLHQDIADGTTVHITLLNYGQPIAAYLK